MLEPAAAAHVAQHATAVQRASIAAVAGNGIAPDGTGYHEFHELLVQASGNPLLTTVLAAVEQAVRWAAAEQNISQFDRDEAAKSHRAIAAAITAKDSVKAQRRMEQHLAAALRHVEASGLRGAPMIPPSRWRGENSDLPWR
ncbi:FCD domain-containing protein [Mycobacterium paraterrae]|uniref:FCD domain-containing protein n=2 Tax=Mycobacterium paraterrae TaxID=577492 RepID=A0ABY3VT44_9MYCO|nr:FCD domain-containing protein [Mycobacterium paraterrae]